MNRIHTLSLVLPNGLAEPSKGPLETKFLTVVLVVLLATVPVLGQPPKSLDGTFDVIVIGLGLAGSELATLLARDNKNFVAFEARSTYGGRVQGVSVGGTTVPGGAGWQQGGGRYHVLTERIATCGVATVRQNWNRWLDFDSKGKSISAAHREFEVAFDCATELSLELQATGRQDMSQDTALKLCGWFKESVGEHLAELSFLEFEWAEPAEVNSLFGANPYSTYEPPHTDEDNLIADPRGFEELAGCWLDRYLLDGGRASPRLRYNSPVEVVDTTRKIVTLKNGKRYRYTTLFDTRSLAVLKYNIIREDGTAYSPPIQGERARSMMTLHFPIYQKIFLKFPTKFWDDWQIYNIFPQSGHSGSVWLNFDIQGFFPGSRILYLTITSPEAQRVELLNDTEVQVLVMPELRKVFGPIPQPVNTYVSRWTFNPLFRGTFSNKPVELTKERWDRIFEPYGSDGSVVFTGEAYCYLQGGYMHSAILAAQTSYDEWKIRKGETPLIQPNPRNNVCFTSTPTFTKRGVKRRHRLNRLDHFGSPDTPRDSDAVHWAKVDERLNGALKKLAQQRNERF